MCLVQSVSVFDETAFPIKVHSVEGRAKKQIGFHRHEYYEMLIVEKGSLENRFETTEIQLKPGDILLIKPYVQHMLSDKSKDTSRAYHCSFLPQVVDCNILPMEELHTSQSPNRYFFKPFLAFADEDVVAFRLKIDAKQRNDFMETIRDLQKMSSEKTERGHALMRFHFLKLLSLLSDQYSGEMVHTTVKVNQEVSLSRYQAGLLKTLNQIHDHFEQPLKIESMAALCGTSESYYCRLFKREVGMTFMSYLNGLRVERACRLLRDTSDSAQDICYQVGFNTYLCFNRQFKNRTGMSPVGFRKKQLKKRCTESVRQRIAQSADHPAVIQLIQQDSRLCIPA